MVKTAILTGNSISFVNEVNTEASSRFACCWDTMQKVSRKNSSPAIPATFSAGQKQQADNTQKTSGQ
jgi:hypothetical protein